MPYFLKAPASMAMNSGACSSDTAGTATLMTLSGVSAENSEKSGTSKKVGIEKRTVQNFISRSFSVLT
jgi:hypothetical protein